MKRYAPDTAGVSNLNYLKPHFNVNLPRCVHNNLKIQAFIDQNQTIPFNKLATCFGYSFVAIIRPIPGMKYEINNTDAILVGDVGSHTRVV